MLGLMMDRPLLIPSILEHAASIHGDQEIITRTTEGPIHRYTYADSLARTKQLARALKRMGIGPGDRVGTIAWNTHRHFEVYYALAGIGAICHTINPLLGPEQIAYVINHAEDKALLFDTTFAPYPAQLRDKLPTVESFIAMTDAEHAQGLEIADLNVYEDLLSTESPDFEWPEFDENTASGLCYTSGTTGFPKGVLYSHRSNVIHAYAAGAGGCMGMTSSDTVLPVVPMFHVNAWGVPYTAAMAGARLVMPGPGMDGASLFELMDNEKVTLSLGVPTVWLGLLKYMDEAGVTLKHMDRTLVGGAALSEHILRSFEEKHDVDVIHGWGMTEMSPLGTVNPSTPEMNSLAAADRIALKLKQGRAAPGMELRIVDAEGRVLPHDGQSAGHLQVRSPWVARAYYRDDSQVLTADGWFDTGDVGNIDQNGYLQITDRSKDTIKSGGEWISSIEIENAALNHPEVANAAAIAAPHPKWQERPLLIAVKTEGAEVTGEALRHYLQGVLPKIAVPDAVEFIDQMPLGPTGKILKKSLRETFKDYVFQA